MSEYQYSDDIRSGYVTGVTFEQKPVEYSVIDDLAIFEGDIVVGTRQEMDQLTSDIQAMADQAAEELGQAPEGVAFGVGITGERYRWPHCVMRATWFSEKPTSTWPRIPNLARESATLYGPAA